MTADLTVISAIMKYHSLKMEEVNETMRHLWNKTYQGTGARMDLVLELRMLTRGVNADLRH